VLCGSGGALCGSGGMLCGCGGALCGSGDALSVRVTRSEKTAVFPGGRILGTSGAPCVLTTAMIGIRVGGEELGHGWVWGIGDAIIHCALDVAKQMLDGMPMGNTRICSE